MTLRGVFFLVSFSLYFFLGLMGSFYNDIVYLRYDLFYDTDPAIKYNLLLMNGLNDLDRHPFIFIITPLLKMLQCVIQNPKLTLLLFQSFVAALNNMLLFWILKRLNVDRVIGVWFTVIYAISFSTLFFVSFPEIYLYSSCIGLLLTYYICGFQDKKDDIFCLKTNSYITSTPPRAVF